MKKIWEDLNDEPPSNQTGMGVSSRVLSSNGAMVGRLEKWRALWNSNWSVCSARGFVSGRRILISENIQEKLNGTYRGV